MKPQLETKTQYLPHIDLFISFFSFQNSWNYLTHDARIFMQPTFVYCQVTDISVFSQNREHVKNRIIRITRETTVVMFPNINIGSAA